MKSRLGMHSSGYLLGILTDLSSIGLLVLSMWLIVSAGEMPPILYLNFAIVGVRALAIGRAVFRYLERLKTHDQTLRELERLRVENFRELVPLVPGMTQGEKQGEILTKLVADIDELQDEHLRVRHPAISSGAAVLLTLTAVLLIDIEVGFLLLFGLLLGSTIIGLTALFISKRATLMLAPLRAELAGIVLERVEAADVLAAYGALRDFDKQVDVVAKKLARAQVKVAGLQSGAAAIFVALGGVVALTVLLIADGSAPFIAAIAILPIAVFEVAGVLPAVIEARWRVRKSRERVQSLISTDLPREIPLETEVVAGPVAAKAGVPAISVKNLTVSYPGSGGSVINNLSFNLWRGEKLMISGNSGVGKSTVALALVRFLDFSGTYEIFGKDVRDVRVTGVRATVGLCEQEPHIFDNDLRQNLLFAKPNASDFELWQVLDSVKLGHWAQQRDGLETWLGDKGRLVSAGQAQRIALARILLAQHPIVVFDEPSAHLDEAQALELHEELIEAVPDDRAVILITHSGFALERDGWRRLRL